MQFVQKKKKLEERRMTGNNGQSLKINFRI